MSACPTGKVLRWGRQHACGASEGSLSPQSEHAVPQAADDMAGVAQADVVDHQRTYVHYTSMSEGAPHHLPCTRERWV